MLIKMILSIYIAVALDVENMHDNLPPRLLTKVSATKAGMQLHVYCALHIVLIDNQSAEKTAIHGKKH
jgi:hypothetical protein